jgi:pyruvate-formate lyase-activating enzyme
VRRVTGETPGSTPEAPANAPPARELRFVAIETSTVCSQRCTFCPVSTQGRPTTWMAGDTLDRVIESLRGRPLETIFLNGFNEPTLTPNLVEIVERLRAVSAAHITLNTNGSALRPALTDRLIAAGLPEVVVNLSTIDPEEYARVRGYSDVGRVVRNVEHLLERAREHSVSVTLLVLGNIDDRHAEAILAIERRFAHLAPKVVLCPLGQYAGDPRNATVLHQGRLRGCGQEDRPNQWVHLAANGEALLCCHDYAQGYVVGDANRQTLDEIFAGDRLERFRRWISGAEEAPPDFICRRCQLAISDRNLRPQMEALFCDRCVLPARFGKERSCGRCAVTDVINEDERRLARLQASVAAPRESPESDVT